MQFENLELFEKENFTNNTIKFVPIKSFDNLNSSIRFELIKKEEFKQLVLPL
jgi:hypothetical protein